MVEHQSPNQEVLGPPPWRHLVVSLSKTHLLPTVLFKPRKRWLRPDLTEKLLTGTLSLNTKKKKKMDMKPILLTISNQIKNHKIERL